MSVFKKHKTHADRSATDRRRHKQKIEKAIREGIYHIVADESIIGQDGKKKIRIPVRGIKEYQFVYGDNQNNKKVGSAPGKNIKRGQQVGDAKKDKVQAEGAGNEPGVEYYEIEITLEELASYLFDNLNLPELEKKQLKKLMAEKMKRHGYRTHGIRPRLDKKKTVKQKIRRKAILDRKPTKKIHEPETEDEERFPFHNSDLRFKHIKETNKEASSAVIFFVMDISGSMTQDKRYLARSFYFLLYQFIKHRYENVDLVFIAHDTHAYVVTEEQFFKRGQGGGTMVSSAIEKTLEIIEKNYHPDSWNIYSFHCSDGDNWAADMEKTIELSERLKEMCQLYCYCEIEPDVDRIKWLGDESRLSSIYQHLCDKHFKIVKINQPADIWPAFKNLFGGNLGV
jgi:sporulation protein YhbH